MNEKNAYLSVMFTIFLKVKSYKNVSKAEKSILNRRCVRFRIEF